MKHLIDPDGLRLPIKLDTTSNGEFLPVPLTPANHHANHLAQESASLNAKRLGLGRRDFLLSTCGAASTLLAFNVANAAAGRTGGFFDLPAVAAVEPAAAAPLESGEFIFDVQGHYVDPTAAWLKVAPESAFKWSPKAGCALADGKTPRSHLACLTSEEFVKDVFLDSDTDMMVLSFVPARARCLAARNRVGGQRAPDRRPHGGQPSAHDPWPGQSQPARRRRGHAAAEGKVRRLRLEDLHAVGTGWHGLLPRRRRRHPLHRGGAPARRQGHLRAQGPAVRAEVLRAQPVPRHRPRREALPGRELPDLPLGLRRGRRGKGLRPEREGRRHRHADPFARGERYRARLECLCGTREHLALPDARSPSRRRTDSASCSSTAARTMCFGERIPSGTDRPRTRSRPSARSRSRRNSARSTATPRLRRRYAQRSSA